ncbi:EAL domain-containing protein [Psychromonas sp. RZ22]|uniref:bifunctional diguanylate cyclase/phosphodiesterase n=1 Tax=Psychromonas algarum TaxID=2555643 RepID=UPI001067E4F4|nr:EAL domain-containing protein [Psychromonas sp. RZ22]TEW55376.1 EAL domain-containing protein [Psychromonas sp. RZ22]
MTLFNQINSLLLGIFLLVISSLVYFQFTETKVFMDNQIESDLNNTTNALTLMLQPHLETGDVIAAETVINVIFEGGFYKKVSLTWLVDQHEKSWENPIQVEDVPQWFLDLNLFQPQSTETIITNGWMQLATLKIEANPAIGYSQLWKVMSDTLMVLAVLFLLSLTILYVRLTKILKPLNHIATQANLIANREFQSDLAIPKTTELKKVVLAMNSMSGQLQNVFAELDKEVITLKNEKLTDKVSQLPNRLFLNSQIESWLGEPGYGGLLIARLDWLDNLYADFGFQIRDNTIRILAKEMQQSLPLIAPCTIARISKKEFAFLVTKASEEQIKVYLQKMIRLINQAQQSTNCYVEQGFTIGSALRITDMTGSQLLANADNALQQALKEQKVSCFYRCDIKQENTLVNWEEQLKEAITMKRFLLQWHPAMTFTDGYILHHEIYTRLNIKNKTIRAAEFMPYIEQLTLGRQFDQLLLETIAESPSIIDSHETIAINITSDSVVDSSFHSWLSLFLSKLDDVSRFHFELRENTILTYPKESVHFAHVIKESGAKIGIDNCGRGIGSLAYLQEIKPDYVKLDQSLSCKLTNKIEMGDLEERSKLTRAIINTARGLDIDVIITAVEDNEQLNRLRSLQATGYQGFITAPSDIA